MHSFAEQVMLTLALIADMSQTITGCDRGAERRLYRDITQVLESDAIVAGNWGLV